MENQKYLFACSILLGVLFDILFFKKSLGISYVIFVIAFYIVFLWILRHKIVFKFNVGWFLTIPILALSVSTFFIFSNFIFSFINFVFIPLLIIGQTVLITGENKYNWFDGRFLDDIFHGIFTRSFSNTPKLFTAGLSSITGKKNDEKISVAKKILIGLVISIPLLMIILSLLGSADVVFNQYLNNISDWIRNLDLADFVLQLILFLFVSMIVFSYIWSFSKSNRIVQTDLQPMDEEKKSHLDATISITVLSLVNFVYLAFILIQFAYMFGSIRSALPSNYTYSEYARRGFFELLVVTLINFTILLIGIHFKPKGGKLVDKTLKVLHSLLVFFTIVILVSAYLRMSLYESAFGYTYLRLLTHNFMILLFVLLLIAFYKIWNEHINLLKFSSIVTLIAYLAINFANIDALITKKNIARYFKTGDLDTEYLEELSYDSLPVLVDLFMEKSIPSNLLHYFDRTFEELSKKQDWQSFHWSKYRAKQALIKYKSRSK